MNRPNTYLHEEVVKTLRDHAATAEAGGQLHSRQLEKIHRERWFLAFVPERLGGLGLSLPEVLRLEEALAWVDGSIGWVVTLCSGAGWFVGFLPAHLTEALLAHRDFCLAGSGAASGTAEKTNDGYLLNGTWKYASGVLHASAYTANCVITEGGKPVLGPDDAPRVLAFLLQKEEIMLQKNWRTTGLVATGSHGFSVMNKAVTSDRAFVISRDAAVLRDPVYQYPFLQLAETTLAVNIAGMAYHFFDLCEPLFDRRMKGLQQPKTNLSLLLESAYTALDRAREDFFQAVETSWSICTKGAPIPDNELERVSLKSNALFATAMRLVGDLYPYAGLSAAEQGQQINRVWRDIHTASQHTLFTAR